MHTSLLLGTRKGLIVFRKKESGWEFGEEHFPAIPVSYAMEDPRSGRWWACLDHGHWGCKLHWSDNQGEKWTEVTAPVYPEGEEIQDGVPASLKYLWAFEAGSNNTPGKLFVGTEPGGLFISNDNGENFELNRGLWDQPSRKQWFGGGRDNAGIHSVIVDPRDDNHIYIGVSCAGVFETKDGGINWKPKNKGLRADFLPDPTSEIGQDPHLVVACPSEPDKMWQQNHCGIWCTIDGGENWTEVSEKDGPANFGFAVAVDEKDGDTAWVVPAVKDDMRVAIDRALCVCRTTDGGKTWKRFSNGLPQRNAYDITFRHALAYSGNTLAFGTTTGNIFISEDRGINWKTLSNNLPMVYSARFGK